jgi:xylose dehydrogenase (NAD/NADP)
MHDGSGMVTFSCERGRVVGLAAADGADPVRIGLVGCGGISHLHARAAESASNAAIVACSDVRRDVAEAWAGRYGCERAYEDYEAMLREHDLDAVLLATWPAQHHEQVLRCLRAGVRNILCEKALATTSTQAHEIWSAARESGAFVMEGFMYRHHPAMRRLEHLLLDGELGDVAHVRATFAAFDPEEAAASDSGRDWRQRLECGGGVPFDLTCYCVNACNRLSPGLPERVFAVGGMSERYATVNHLYALIEYESGGVGVVESTRRGGFRQGIHVACVKGHLSLPATWIIEGPTVVDQRGSDGWRTVASRSIPIDAADPYRLQLENFAAAIRGDAAPVVTLAESVVGMYTLQGAVDSLVRGQPVEIALPEAIVAELRATESGT